MQVLSRIQNSRQSCMNECSKSTVPVSSFWFHSLDPLINLPFRKSNQNRLGRFRAWLSEYRFHPSILEFWISIIQNYAHKLYKFTFIKNLIVLITDSCEGLSTIHWERTPPQVRANSKGWISRFSNFTHSLCIIHESRVLSSSISGLNSIIRGARNLPSRFWPNSRKSKFTSPSGL